LCFLIWKSEVGGRKSEVSLFRISDFRRLTSVLIQFTNSAQIKKAGAKAAGFKGIIILFNCLIILSAGEFKYPVMLKVVKLIVFFLMCFCPVFVSGQVIGGTKYPLIIGVEHAGL